MICGMTVIFLTNQNSETWINQSKLAGLVVARFYPPSISLPLSSALINKSFIHRFKFSWWTFLMKFKPCMKVCIGATKFLSNYWQRWVLGSGRIKRYFVGGGENPRMDGIVFNLPWFKHVLCSHQIYVLTVKSMANLYRTFNTLIKKNTIWYLRHII